MRRGPKSLARLTATYQHLMIQHMRSENLLTSITRLHTKTCSDSKDQEEKSKRKPIAATSGYSVIRVILQSKNYKHEDSTGDELGEEHAGLGHVCFGVRAKDSCCRRWTWRYCPDAMAFESVDVVDVVAVYDGSSNQTSQELRQEVYWKSSPRKLAKKAVGEGDGWIQVCSGVTSNVDT
jgi:hypothetical protein